MVLYLYITQGQGQITPGGRGGGQILIITKLIINFATLIVHCKFQPLVLKVYWEKNDFFFNFSPDANL